MKKIISIISFLIVAMFHAQNLTDTENYIYSRTYLEPVTSEQPNAAQIQEVKYLDGLGRVMQSITVKASPSGKDLIIPSVYDQSGKQTRNFLPQPVDSQNGAFIPGVGESSVNAHYGVPNAYSEVLYEKSPLARILKSAAPGTDWQISGTHTQKTEYLSNDADKVKKYKAETSWNASSQINDVSVMAAPDDQYTTNGYYNANTLYKIVARDENDSETQTFVNSKKQTLLVRTINRKPNGATENLDTYYVYDVFDNLSLVIPPKAAVSALTPDIIGSLCYQYKYDQYNRVVEMKIPGKGWEYLVYDQQGRVVLSQDANLRTTTNNFAKKGWIFSKYDSSGRVVYTGFFANTAERSAMQTALNNMSANANNNEAPSKTPFTLNGIDIYYTKKAFPTGSMTILSVNYYDEYPVGSPVQPSHILNQTTLVSSPTAIVSNGLSSIRSTKALPTASYTKNVENDSWSSAFIWYDTLGRGIGTYSKNHLGGYTRTEAELDFSGAILKSFTYHARKADEPGVVIRERFAYDAAKRLKQHYHQIDNRPEELLAEYTYNELSQVINKKVGNNVQSIDYSYNIRGWLTDINKNQMNVPDLGGKLFAYKIKYTQKDGIDNPDTAQFGGKNVRPGFDGSITETDWRAVETIGVNPSLTPKRYGYSYDSASRLLAGYYQNPDNPYSRENTEVLDYDLNGNISHLYRTSITEYGSNTATVIDRLAYTYSGNRLTRMTDLSQNPTGYEGGGNTIAYDGNGNMLSMPDKGIFPIKYNYLDLPDLMEINRNGNENILIRTLYNADGTKLRKQSITTVTGIAGSTVLKKITDYLDGFQYVTTENTTTGSGGTEMLMASSFSLRAMQPQAFSVIAVTDPPIQLINGGMSSHLKTPDLQYFATAEGYYDYQKDQYIYQYIDHLGNVRVSYGRNSAGALEITDNNDYYPFGMNHLKTGNSYFAQGSYKSNKYNSKELQETGIYSYGWREYMPDMGIWNGIDRLAENYLSAGPYAYVLNNPINRFDPDGRATAPWTVMWDKTPEGTNSYWYNDGNGFTSYDGGGKGGGGGAGLAYNSTVSYDGHFTMGDWTYALPPVMINSQGNSSTWNNTVNLGANSLQMYSKFTGVLGRFTFDQNSSLLADAVENTKVGRSVSAAENFLFLELPASMAGGELLAAGWRAAGISKYLGQAFNYVTKGGPTFAEYRAAYWAKNIKPAMKIIEGEGVHAGKQWQTFTELHHRFIPQRVKWAPNWLLNNRINLQPLNALEHAMKDPYRARFAPKWVKEQYKLIWK